MSSRVSYGNELRRRPRNKRITRVNATGHDEPLMVPGAPHTPPRVCVSEEEEDACLSQPAWPPIAPYLVFIKGSRRTKHERPLGLSGRKEAAVEGAVFLVASPGPLRLRDNTKPLHYFKCRDKIRREMTTMISSSKCCETFFYLRTWTGSVVVVFFWGVSGG